MASREFRSRLEGAIHSNSALLRSRLRPPDRTWGGHPMIIAVRERPSSGDWAPRASRSRSGTALRTHSSRSRLHSHQTRVHSFERFDEQTRVDTKVDTKTVRSDSGRFGACTLESFSKVGILGAENALATVDSD